MKDMDVRARAMLEESEIPTDGSDPLVELLVGFEKRYVDAVPEPSRELAVLLGDEKAAQEGPRLLGPRRRNALAAGVVALGAVVTTGLAAAANELPEPAQRWVSELSQRYLPFDLPSPTDPGTAGIDVPRRPGGGPGTPSGEDEAARAERKRHLTTQRERDDTLPPHTSAVGSERWGETDDDGAGREVEEAEVENRYVGARESTEETEGASDPEGDTAPLGASQSELDESDEPQQSEDEAEPQEPEQEEPEGSGDD